MKIIFLDFDGVITVGGRKCHEIKPENIMKL